MHRSQTAVDGERRQITVLFADVRDSFRLIRDRDAEDAAALFDAVLATMTEAVHHYEGVVNQVLGDGVMAIFGAPVAQEDHVLRAACAALRMQRSITELKHPTWQARRLTPQIRIGLNSGEVVLRTIRTDLSVDYRAVGSTIHLAARLEGLAEPGQVLVSGQTRRLGGKWLKTRSIGEHDIKGLDEPSQVFELLGASVRSRFQAIDPRELSVLTGRDAVLAELASVMRRAFAGEHQTIVLSGEPGVGKSRVCYELLRVGGAEGCRVLEAFAPSYGRARAHGLLARIARALFGVDEDDDPAQIEAKARDAMRESEYGDDDRVEFARVLLDLPNSAPTWKRLDPVQRRRRIEATLRRLLAVWCANGPAVLLLEDVHWSDPASLEFVFDLIREPLAPNLLLLITHRSEHAIEWPRVPGLRTSLLPSLDPAAVESLLRNLVGAAPELAAVRGLVAKRAAGNPFFLEESTQSLLERGVLIGTPGRYEVAGDLNQVDVPETIEALLSARVDRLPLQTLDLLEALAVAGDQISAVLLSHIVALSPASTEQRLAPLLEADLVYQPADVLQRVYRLKHALIAEVVYRRLLKPRRKLWHARVVDGIEQVYKLRIGEHVERLADHCHRAELWAKSIYYHQLACQRALRHWANEQAMLHIERGLATLEFVEPGPERDAAAVDLRLLALAPLVPTGAHDRMLQLLEEAQGFARGLGDVRRQAAVSSQLALGYWMVGQHDAALDSALNALALANQLGNAELGLIEAARHNIAMIHHARGELPAALELLRELLGHFSGPNARKQLRGWAGYPGVYTRTFLISCLSMTGGFAEAARMFAEGRAVADEVEHSHSRTMIMEEHGFCLLVQGEWQAAREILTLALEICERDQIFVMHTPIVARLGVALVECGEVERGLSLLQAEFDRGTYRLAAHYGLSYLLIGLARARECAGDLAGSIAISEEAERVTREAGEHGYHVCALVQYASALRAIGRRQDAHRAYQLALQNASLLEMAPFQAFALEGLGCLEADAGHLAQAERLLDAALQHWKGAGAPRRIVELEAQLARVTRDPSESTALPDPQH